MEENKKVVETEFEEKEDTCKNVKLMEKLKNKFKKDKTENVECEEKKPVWKKVAKVAGIGLGAVTLVGIGMALQKGNAPLEAVSDLVESDLAKNVLPEATEKVVETME